MKSLQSRRCIVLGAGGFLGRNLCLRLAGRTGHLRAFGRHVTSPTVLEGLDWYSGDLNDPASIADAIRGFHVVFHLINTTTPASANRDKAADVRSNVIGTLQLLDACCSEGVEKLIFASSGGTIYGIPPVIPTHEDVACWPITGYGVSKLAIERYLHLYEYMHNLDYRVLRVANPFGPFQTTTKNQGVIGAFIDRILTGLPIEVWGDGTVSRDFTYVDDVVEAFELAALHTGSERVFNIGSGIARSLNEIIDTLAAITGSPISIERRDGRLVDVPISLLDIQRAEQALGWRPRTEFIEGLRRTVNWARAQANSDERFGLVA